MGAVLGLWRREAGRVRGGQEGGADREDAQEARGQEDVDEGRLPSRGVLPHRALRWMSTRRTVLSVNVLCLLGFDDIFAMQTCALQEFNRARRGVYVLIRLGSCPLSLRSEVPFTP